MPGKNKETLSKRLTLKDIEKHLNEQDKKLERGSYFSGYLFGAMLVIVAISIAAGRFILQETNSLCVFCILLGVGGTAIMLFAWHKRLKYRSKDNSDRH